MAASNAQSWAVPSSSLIKDPVTGVHRRMSRVEYAQHLYEDFLTSPVTQNRAAAQALLDFKAKVHLGWLALDLPDNAEALIKQAVKN